MHLIFTIPGRPFPHLRGEAFAPLYINIYEVPGTLEWHFTAFHEIAHHVLGHAEIWPSQPTWQREYEADLYALERMAELYCEETVYSMEQQCKEQLRPSLQTYLDCGITQHGEVDAAVWAGVPLDLDFVMQH